MEIWADIKDYEGIYQVSNKGRVRTCEGKTTESKLHGTRVWKQRILKQKISKDKCCRVELWKNKKQKTLLVHRLVACTFYDVDIDTKLTVNHKDGNRLNNNLYNLEIVSLADNIRHGFESGLYKNVKRVKLTNKFTGESNTFPSMQRASNYMNRNHGYIHSKLSKGIDQDNLYQWQVMI